MAYRNLMISSEADLTLKNKQLCIKTESISDTVPVEDIDSILIESRRTIVSTALLSALAKNGTTVFICDEYHMPCGVLLPYLQHSSLHEVVKRQLDMTVPTKKQLWKQVVTSKIMNQAACLSLCGSDDVARELEHIARNVKSGDSDHSESHAAAKYFAALYGKGFVRSHAHNNINSWLNYGYAIIRGCVARTLAVYGFFQTFGIQHHSRLNQFNLADDFMEPFRPLVDLFVARNATIENDLMPDSKKQLYSLLNHNMSVSGKKYALSYAIELTVKSFSSILMDKRKGLLLPQLVELEPHKYE